MTIKELTSAYKSGSLTPSEHIKTLLKKIDETSDYRYFVYVAANEALRSAEEADARYKEGRPLSA
ncbi:MAG: amidase, partial [Firmicutes bacterium]|nr:amidase [Bacillota bacterium]